MSMMASFYKCALQVNSFSYARYRGDEPDIEEKYNKDIVEHCKKNSIAIVGLADHGNVDSSSSLRKALVDGGITVFPGFELSTAEKIHIVCLFPEDYDNSQLNRILGSLGIVQVKTGTEVSKLPCMAIANVINENKGFWYAAHITGDNGILKLGKNQHIWIDKRLIAAQIPASKEEIDPAFKNIIGNTDPQYKRQYPLAYINASDIERPEDLDKDNASVLVKMSTPNFENFCSAFKDPQSRIRLNSERENNYQSCIKRIKIIGGYLDGLDVELSENLSTIIGGRGTGKSTLISLIRYALEMKPLDNNSITEFDRLIEHNLGTGGRVELSVLSNTQHGQTFHIIRRFKQHAVIMNDDNNVSPLNIHDILPKIEIYGQNEIMEVAKDNLKIRDVADRLFKVDKEIMSKIEKSYNLLKQNSRDLKKLEDQLSQNTKYLNELPLIEEKLRYYQDSGIEEKLSVIKKISSEEGRILALKKTLPETAYKIPLIVKQEEVCTDCAEVSRIHEAIQEYNKIINRINQESDEAYRKLVNSFQQVFIQWNKNKEKYDDQLRDMFKKINGIQDMTSEDIVNEYSTLIKQQEEYKPLALSKARQEKNIEQRIQERKNLIESCRKAYDLYNDSIKKQLKKINKKKLNNKVKLEIEFQQNKQPLLEYLKKTPQIGDKSLKGIEEYHDFSTFTFVEDIRMGVNYLKGKYKLTEGTANKLINYLSNDKLREIEELRLKDVVNIYLKVGSAFKKLSDLSKGQQCTAILNILLIDNKDPLIIDQPEDNLDNSFIAENLVETLRNNKIKRQYLFATHNANIPVFGDAEQIIAMEESNSQGRIIDGGIGSIDDPVVKSQVVNILEGGATAFRMREEKYGI